LKIEVDLRAPTVKADQRIWRMFPGPSYQFLGDFISQKVGFLDTPGFEFPDNGLLGEAKDIIARVARSEAIKEQLIRNGPTYKPTANLVDFLKSRSSQNRTRIANAIVTLFEVANKGDFVVLPEPIHMSKIWVGQILDEKRSADQPKAANYSKKYGKCQMPARRINWIGSYEENTISKGLSDALRHQHPFTLLEKSFHIEVLSLAHGSFVYGERFASTIYNDKNDFLDSDAALLGAISRLAAAACMAVDQQKAIKHKDLVDILLRSPPIEYTCSQVSDVHSPGFNRYVAGSFAALVIATVTAYVLGVAQNSAAAATPQPLPIMVVINSAPGADPACTARVSEASAKVLEALGTERTWALCEAARAASERAGLRSSAVPRKK
jgi:hypothetical protein